MCNFPVQCFCLFFTAASVFCGKRNFKAVSVHLSVSQGCSDLPKVCLCAGTKWLFSLHYVPQSQCVTRHLMGTSQVTRKLFHIQSPTESITDQLSPFLILGPTPSGRRVQLQSVALPRVRVGMWTRALLPSLACGRRRWCCLFPSSCWYCSVDVSASCRAVVTGDNVGNVVLLSTAGDEVCMALCRIFSTGIFMSHVLFLRYRDPEKSSQYLAAQEISPPIVWVVRSPLLLPFIRHFHAVECNGSNSQTGSVSSICCWPE